MQLGWRPRIIKNFSEPAWATLVRVKSDRFPWIKCESLVAAAITPDRQLVLINLPSLDEVQLERLEPFSRFTNVGMRDMAVLSEAVFWPECEALYSRYFARDMLAEFPSLAPFVQSIEMRFQSKALPGWHVLRHNDQCVWLVKDFTNINSLTVAVTVTSHGATIYSKPINMRSRMLVDERYRHHFINWNDMSISALQVHLEMLDAIDVANVFRSLRWWFFRAVVDELSLPF